MSEASRKGGGVYDVRNDDRGKSSDAAYESIDFGHQYPVNPLSQLIASLLAYSHLRSKRMIWPWSCCMSSKGKINKLTHMSIDR